jgi:GxxExxY protein
MESAESIRVNELAAVVVDVAIRIHRKLGPGLLESAYVSILAHELTKRGLSVAREVPIPVEWDGIRLEVGFRADLIVEDRLIIEVKSVAKPNPVYQKQLLTYLRLSNKRLGLLLNFGESLMKQGIERVANRLEE